MMVHALSHSDLVVLALEFVALFECVFVESSTFIFASKRIIVDFGPLMGAG